MKIPEAKQVAVEFCKVIRACLTEAELAEVIQRNADDDSGAGCASHDFCDANMAMDDAFLSLGFDVRSTGVEDSDSPLMSDEVLEVWHDAWDLAKDAKFQPEHVGLKTFLMTDQPPTCPECGARVEIIEGAETNKQVCLCPACKFTFKLEEEECEA